ncbi:MAG: acetolactate synthase small subunit [Bacillota bacterium]
MSRHTLALIVNNKAGVLSQIASLFTRRGYNIDTLSVGKTQTKEFSRMTITFKCNKETFEQIIKQFNKLIDVIKVIELPQSKSIYRELILIKIKINKENRSDILDIVNIYKGKILNFTKKNVIIELTGNKDKIDAFNSLIKTYEIKELVRTGFTGLLK